MRCCSGLEATKQPSGLRPTVLRVVSTFLNSTKETVELRPQKVVCLATRSWAGGTALGPTPDDAVGGTGGSSGVPWTQSGAWCQAKPYAQTLGTRQALGTTPRPWFWRRTPVPRPRWWTAASLLPIWRLTNMLHAPRSIFSPSGRISPSVVVFFTASRAAPALLRGRSFSGAVAGTPNATSAHFSHHNATISNNK